MRKLTAKEKEAAFAEWPGRANAELHDKATMMRAAFHAGADYGYRNGTLVLEKEQAREAAKPQPFTF